MADVCACDIHESGAGLVPCMGHADRIRHYQAMYKALRALSRGEVDDDPGEFAMTALEGVPYWHFDHPTPAHEPREPSA